MTRELEALLKLVDDPDDEVYHVVSKKILNYGKEAIPYLQQYENINYTQATQERIEHIVHKMYYNDLVIELDNWACSEEHDVLYGAYLMALYNDPNTEYNTISSEIDRLKKHIWIELNSYLTPIEKINVINNIIFKQHRYSGTEINYDKPTQFLLPNLIDTKKGNSYALVVLYTVLSQSLDVPVFALQFPKQIVLCYLDPLTDYFEPNENNFYKIKFFIDPIFGNIISHNDVELFFKRINVPLTSSYFRPLSNKSLIQNILLQYAKCHKQIEKADELNELVKLLD